MKLTLTRSQKSSGVLSKSVKFTLVARVQLTEAEAANVKKYKMGREVIYSKDRIGFDETDYKSAKGWAKNIAAFAAAITITVDDLIGGKTIECKDITEIMAMAEQFKQACSGLSSMLLACSGFEGEEVIDY